MTRQLSAESSLENFKREAKRWLRALREHNPVALERLRRANTGAASPPALRDVQLAIAREYGFDGWNTFSEAVAHIEQERRARTISAQSAAESPEARNLNDLISAIARGDTQRAAEVLDAHPQLINERGSLPGHTGLRTALHFAIGLPNAHELIQMLLQRGANPNIRDDGDNAYPLHFAAEQNNVVLVQELLEHGADVDGSGDFHELGVLGWATVFATGTGEAARLLLQHGAKHTLPSAVVMGDTLSIQNLVQDQSQAALEKKLDAANRRRSLLHLAVIKNQPQSLATLISLGANLNATDVAGLTALDQAALDGKTGMADMLLRAGAAVTLPAAIALERIADAERLLHADVDQLKPGRTYGQLIVQASERASAAVIKLLLLCGANPNARAENDSSIDGATGYTALHAAAFHGNAEAVEILMNAGASPRAREERYCGSPAGWARYAKHHEIADRILRGDIDIFDAADFNLAPRIREIVARDPGALRRPLGTYVRCELTPEHPWKNPSKTPLDAAIESGSADAEAVLRELLANTRHKHDEIIARFLTDACRDWRVSGGGTDIRMSLHTASRLLEQHPDIARENIFTAVVCGDAARVSELLRAEPGLSAARGGPYNWTPLLYLASARLLQSEVFENAVEIAELLLDHGADPNAYYADGSGAPGSPDEGNRFTAITCALGMGEQQFTPHPDAEDLVALLLSRGAEPYDLQSIYNVFAQHGSRVLLKNDIVWWLELMYQRAMQLGRKADWEDGSWSMFSLGGYGPGAHFLLKAALDANLLELAEWMLQHGASPNVRASNPRSSRYSLFEEAVRSENVGAQQLLARYGAETFVHIAVSAYETFIDRCLHNDRAGATADIDAHPEWLSMPHALMAATRKDNASAVQLLLDLGVSPDIEENRSRARALHAAAFAGAARAAKVLAEAGADVDARELNYGATPMNVAAWAQKPLVTEVLTPYSRDLFSLVVAGKVARVREVLAESPSLATAVNANGDTLLMRLPDSENDAVLLAELLLSHGADRQARNARGATAAELAEQRGMLQVAALLRT